ncbi:hypothetical protein SCP_0700030 [Sparassis crispa]|uniref:Uncharacterized protein n=1 Tax=Sparassis crispa TaxID=139825 RepID=A0A401GRI7_9APHY|nr:hypothetical protein SCP_0700030 [Sparassis crispa]GBE84823.1 hypothetical protein SCP_0700030 [Sparassis crispa]
MVSYDSPPPPISKKRRQEDDAGDLAGQHSADDGAIAGSKLAAGGPAPAVASTYVHYEPPRAPALMPEVSGLLTMSREGFVYPPTSSYGLASAREPAWQPPMNPPAAVAAAGSLRHSLARLELKSHDTRVKKVQLDQDDNQTSSSYDCHVKNYATYWATFQAERCQRALGEVPVPVFPVTALKASFFLEYEIMREKCRQGKNEAITGSNMGKSHISQVINALESWHRNNAYLYKDDPDAQMSLRTDICIHTAESSAKHQEPKCIEKTQALKAAGSSGDTYTPDELKRCLIWCLMDVSGVKSIWIGLRDRAMLLLSSTMAFRGESSHILEWLDLFLSSIPMDDVKPIQPIYT